MTTHHGECLCGKVTWEFSGEPTGSYHCHCAMCRKAHGAAFGTYYFVPADHFKMTAGEYHIHHFDSSEDLTRSFCPDCGSVVPNADSEGKYYFVPAGSHTNGPAVDSHIFVGSKAPWHDIGDDLPQHETYEPGEDATVIADKTLPPKPEGVVARGSCLCGAVEFEMIEPFKVVHNCHCSRCRRARAAAFTTNGFTSAEGIRFLKGEDHISVYKVLDARFFTHAFCDTCGSGLPRVDERRKLAAIPLGALDDDPGQGPVDHIFVENKADWYRIGGELPQFPQGPG